MGGKSLQCIGGRKIRNTEIQNTETQNTEIQGHKKNWADESQAASYVRRANSFLGGKSASSAFLRFIPHHILPMTIYVVRYLHISAFL